MTGRAQLLGLVDAFAGTRVLCVGDVMLDRYIHGTVERVSPEAPIPVLRIERDSTMLGGAGNVVRNLVALGARARLASVVGADAAGEEIRRSLAEQDRIAYGLVVDADRQTAIKTRYLAGAQQILRADRETVAPVPAAIRGRVFEAVEALLADSGAMVLSDYGKGVLADTMARDLIVLARAQGRTVVVDPKGADYERYRYADVITPNRVELAEATGRPTRTIGEVTDAAGWLHEKFGFGTVIATLGKDGMMIVGGLLGPVHLLAEQRDVFDVSGAGDTVVAALAAALAAGADMVAAAELANVAAGIVVGKVGTATAYASEVVAALHHKDRGLPEPKRMRREAAHDRVEIWRRQGLRIGFTNGCFDLLHPGHVSLLEQAKRSCDRLIVGLNSDSSVARLKGDGRPIQPEPARAAVLASLAAVDLVVVFDEDTPLQLIRLLRPDLLVKGADYRLDEVVGSDVVREYGGEVLLVRIEPGFSTSATIARIAERTPSRTD
jgi:D-beta-D-heptose 7-phosphate kinase/D-beta-D-heptose 1-phosphate adenosyltransferase